MLGFAPNASLPIADNGVQALLDMGGAESAHAYGVGTIANGARGGGGTYQRIRSVPSLAQRFYAESAVNAHLSGRVYLTSYPAPIFNAQSTRRIHRFGDLGFVVYDLPSVVVEHRSVAESWSHFATSEHDVFGVELESEPSQIVQVSVVEMVGLSVAPIVEMETDYAL